MSELNPFFNAVPDGLAGGLFIYDAQGDEEIFYADSNVVELFGCSSQAEFRELVGNSFRGMVHPDDLERVEERILTQTFSSGRWHDYVRYRIRTRQGDVRYVEDFGHLLRGKDGKFYFYVFIVEVDESDYNSRTWNSFAESELFIINNKVDPLTGLLNMTAFQEKAQSIAPDAAKDAADSSTVVVFDILGLREVNRTTGRNEGDGRILALASAMRACMPQGSQFYRGHEAELIAVCPHMSESDLMPSILEVVNACKSPVLYGIGSTAGPAGSSFAESNGTLLQALDEAHADIGIKKMLNSASDHSQALTSLVRALEEVDADTEAHVQRTQKMGIALGRKIGLSDVQLTTLQLLCLLHDIGKITVPLEILNKPGRLTDEEWATLRMHAEKGYQIAMASDELKPIAEMIRYHHERWDGRGYPLKLNREEIPVLSRIISIVDAYDAMVNDRAYRPALMPEMAKKEIRDNAGTQFDPSLAEAFLELLEENPALAVGAKTGGREVRVYEQYTGDAAKDAGTGNTTPVRYTKYILDVDNVILDTDPYFEELTGYSREDAVGKMIQFDLVPPEDREAYIAQVQNQFTKGDYAYLRHRIRRKDGRIITVICNGERYFDSSVRAFRSTILVYEV